jgi:hypothetical protein
MKKNGYKLTICFTAVCASLTVMGQNLPVDGKICGAADLKNEFFAAHPEAKQQEEALEKFTATYVEHHKNTQQQATRASKYIIPCVFHVYGTKQGGKDVTLAVIESALNEWAEKDFHGKNDDYNTVHNSFKSIRDTVSISFVLAKKDPAGNPTTGVTFHPVAKGFGNATGYDDKIKADAWNNYEYMNFYIMNDLYADGNVNNSGSTTPPLTAAFDMGVARMVYNGAYLGTNAGNKEFGSVVTHEIGHFLNLTHTFQDGCQSATNDNVADTPPVDYDGKTTCHTSATVNAPLNCKSQLINVENYMDYTGVSGTGCYKMFTQGQVLRMKAALEILPLKSLWQTSNLIKTGIKSGTVGIMEETTGFHAAVYPNPGNGIFNLNISTDEQGIFNITIMNVIGNTVFSTPTIPLAGEQTIPMDLSSLSQGVYFLSVKNTESQQLIKVVIQ